MDFEKDVKNVMFVNDIVLMVGWKDMEGNYCHVYYDMHMIIIMKWI